MGKFVAEIVRRHSIAHVTEASQNFQSNFLNVMSRCMLVYSPFQDPSFQCFTAPLCIKPQLTGGSLAATLSVQLETQTEGRVARYQICRRTSVYGLRWK